jgi:hypothetical protein
MGGRVRDDELESPATPEEREEAARLVEALEGRAAGGDSEGLAVAALLGSLGSREDEVARARLRRALVARAAAAAPRRVRTSWAFLGALAASVLLAAGTLLLPRGAFVSREALLEERERAARAAVERLASRETGVTATLAEGLRTDRLSSLFTSLESRRMSELGESAAVWTSSPSPLPTRSARTGGAS